MQRKQLQTLSARAGRLRTKQCPCNPRKACRLWQVKSLSYMPAAQRHQDSHPIAILHFRFQSFVQRM